MVEILRTICYSITMSTNETIINPLGCKIKIQWLDDGTIQEFKIVDTKTANEGEVSCDTAFALSLKNRKQGDIGSFSVNNNINRYTILEVQLGPNQTEHIANSVERCITERNITKLYHFTAVENLPSILKHGILSRSNMDNRGIKYSANDNLRLDNRPYLISCSIEHPNNSLLWKYKYESGKDFCLLELDIQLLIEIGKEMDSPTRCSIANAAKRKGSSLLRISDIEYLFGGIRNPLLPSNYTTNEQAEVLIYKSISVQYIKRIIFHNELDYSKYICLIPNQITSVVDTSLFNVRQI